MKIMVVDPCELDRGEMIHLLRCQPDLEIAGYGEIGPEVVEQARLNRPDVVLIDSNLFEAGGREMMNIILSEFPDTSFIILAPGEDIELLLEALRNGARGYLPKNISESVLFRSLDAVERGELAVSKSMMATVVSELRKILQVILASENDFNPTLTPKELEILRLLVKEARNEEIARQLLISYNVGRMRGHSDPGRVRVRVRPQSAKFAERVGINPNGTSWTKAQRG